MEPIELAPLHTHKYLSFLTEDIPPHDYFPPTPHVHPSTSHTPSDPTCNATTTPTLIQIFPKWRKDLHALLEIPRSSPSAFLVHMSMLFLILFSALVTILETVPAFHAISTNSWFGVETALVVLFTIEYIGRCLAWSTTWTGLLRWQTSFFGIIDLLSVAPYYVELMAHQDTSVLFRFSILRMFRLLRVFKPFRYNNTILLTIEVMYVSVRRSQHALLAIAFFVAMILTIFSTLLYFAERGTWDPILDTFVNVDGDPTQFSSIPAAAWFVIVTITTVGYGEITPRSFLGRLVTLPILMFGLLLITLPSFVLGREFSLVWEKMTSRTVEDDDMHATDSPVDTPFHFPFAHQATMNFHSDRISYREVQSNDLTNRKLAQNQTELSRQIVELQSKLEAQGALLEKVLKIMERKEGNYFP